MSGTQEKGGQNWSLTYTEFNQNEKDANSGGHSEVNGKQKETRATGNDTGLPDNHKTVADDDTRELSKPRKDNDMGKNVDRDETTNEKDHERKISSCDKAWVADILNGNKNGRRKSVGDSDGPALGSMSHTQPVEMDVDTVSPSPELASPNTRNRIRAQITEVRNMKQSIAQSVKSDTKDMSKFGVLPPIHTQAIGKMSNQKVPEKSLASSAGALSVKAPINTPASVVNGGTGKVQHIYVRFPGQRTGQMVL